MQVTVTCPRTAQILQLKVIREGWDLGRRKYVLQDVSPRGPRTHLEAIIRGASRLRLQVRRRDENMWQPPARWS